MKLYHSRRVFQTIFFITFLIILTLTYRPFANFYHSIFLLSDPLIALLSLSRGAVGWKYLGAILVVALTIALGRVFCGYICPLGLILDIVKPQKTRYTNEKLNGFFGVPLLFLTTLLIFSFLGSSLFFIFDPIVLLTRSTATLVYSILDKFIRAGGDLLYHIESLQPYVDAATNIASGIFIFESPLRYQLQVFTLTFFMAVVMLSFLQSRFWCRHLCPLGALLGLISRISLWGRRVIEDRCTSCQECIRVCPLGAVRAEGLITDKSLCQLCFNCADICPSEAINFGPSLRSESFDPSRRVFLSTVLLASAYGFLVGKLPASGWSNSELLRPPGAKKEKEFLGRCARCGECIKACPTNVIQPSLVKSGLEGIFTPELDFSSSYCDWSCNTCGKVCPTEAISSLSLEKKRRSIIGRANIDRNRCLPWSKFENCIVCQELCPVPDKAIILKEEKILTPERRIIVLKRPFVVSERCIGCGICQCRCPVPEKSAIVIYRLKDEGA